MQLVGLKEIDNGDQICISSLVKHFVLVISEVIFFFLLKNKNSLKVVLMISLCLLFSLLPVILCLYLKRFAVLMDISCFHSSFVTPNFLCFLSSPLYQRNYGHCRIFIVSLKYHL